MLEVLTIFLGAFLVFLVQPLIGNVLLPAFGGTVAVWSACLAAFQILLVGGYFYAHVTGRQGIGTGRRLGVHATLLFVATGWLFYVAIHYRSMLAVLSASEVLPPACGALLCIAALVAGPYILLSSNSSLVQVLAGGKYKLYAISNLGSMLGLLIYPLLFEPFLPLSKQWLVFATVAGLYAVLFTTLLLRRSRSDTSYRAEVPTTTSNTQTFKRSSLSYFILSFISCYLLNAISTHLCADITPLPMLWAGLLAVYLLSYILAFTDCGARIAPLTAILVVPLSIFGAWHFGMMGSGAFPVDLAVGFLILLLGGWIVHSRLYRLRPAAEGLTRYYLMISVGGAVGGATCSFLMPALSNIVAEYPIALAAVLGVIACDARDALVAFVRRPSSQALLARTDDPQVKALFAFVASLGTPHGEPATRQGAQYVRYSIVALLSAFALYGIVRGHNTRGTVLCRYRNFYGLGYVVHRMMEVDGAADYPENEFISNGTTHGMQKCEGAWHSMEPTAYFTAHAGGLALTKHEKRARKEPMRVALCGMGIGTLAAYAQEGDFFRFYEINPDVDRIARDRRLFTFVPDAAGKVEVVLDDARRALAREAAAGEPKYDVIVVDVFNGDSIPPHMATREAFNLYLDRLAPKGILAIHISNWHLDLLPMVKAAAKEFDLNVEAFGCCGSDVAFQALWAFLSYEPLSQLYDKNLHARMDLGKTKDIPLMDDDFHSLLPYLRLNTEKKE